MHGHYEGIAERTNLWILVCGTSLSVFFFVILYLYILSPESNGGRNGSEESSSPTPPRSKTPTLADELESSMSESMGDKYNTFTSRKIISVDGKGGPSASHRPKSATNFHLDLARFFTRAIGGYHNSGRISSSSIGEEYSTLRPFRALSFLFITLPTSFMIHRNSMSEHSVST